MESVALFLHFMRRLRLLLRGKLLRLLHYVRVICLGLAILFEIRVSLLPNGTVIYIVAHLTRSNCHFFLLFFFLLDEHLRFETQPGMKKQKRF